MVVSRVVSAPCPSCPRGLVLAMEASWRDSPLTRRRSVWAAEPLRCQRGCLLSTAQAVRLLSALYARPVWQLPLPLEVA